MRKLILVLGIAAVVNPAWSFALELERTGLEAIKSIEVTVPEAAKASEIVPFQSGAQFACMSAGSNVLFDLKIADVGDESGEVVVNDGGAPKTFKAGYNNGRFVFGNNQDSVIVLPPPGYFAWVVGTVRHDGSNGKLICQYGKAVSQTIPASLGSRSAFSCIGTRTEKMYDLNIVDVGDESGKVVINAGGAPETFNTDYKNGRFLFGTSLIELDQPYWYEWTTGKAVDVKGLSEPLVCKSRKYGKI
ncbi:MAG: hypothetical protein NTY45_08390 [Elusimicrobia bacterium]|nr:hypothetical protein [Elusimicrobiota bacterium]